MTKLVFTSSINPRIAKPIELDVADVLAVRNLGAQKLSDGTFAHRREVYTKHDPMMTVWDIAKSSTVPPATAQLDKLGGKPFVSLGSVYSHGTGNGSFLASADPILVSIDQKDAGLIKKFKEHASGIIAGAGLNASLTNSGRVETLQRTTNLHYASLIIGEAEQRVPVAHVDAKRFASFDAFGG